MATIVITGSNRGIGLRLAQLYTDAGHQLISGVRKPESATELPGEILPLDVGDDASVAGFAKALNGQPVDILINNAGVGGPDRQSSLDMDFPGFLEALNVNTLGPLRVTQALLPNLRAAGSAKVAILSSRMGSFSDPTPSMVAYRASKTAVNKVIQCLAADLEPQGIAVAALHPGWVRTDMGGAGADLAPEESAMGLKTVIDGLSLATTGRFWNHDGSPIDW